MVTIAQISPVRGYDQISPLLTFFNLLQKVYTQAILKQEDWTGYLSLGVFCWFFCFCHFVVFLFSRFCFINCFFFYYYYVCMYISLYKSYIFSPVNSVILPSLIWKLNFMNTQAPSDIYVLLCLFLLFVCLVIYFLVGGVGRRVFKRWNKH